MNDKNYTPYGEDWKAEVMKHRKGDIVEMLKKAYLDLARARYYEEQLLIRVRAGTPIIFDGTIRYELSSENAKHIDRHE
jgi:hypothetical protein